MPIRVGEHPKNEKGSLNKFIAPGGEGQRGKLLALSPDKKEGIVLALNSSFKGDVRWGRLYHVKEDEQDKWPVVVEEVREIPESFKIVKELMA